MKNNVDIFSLPGFQPLTAPHQEERIFALVDGSIDVEFYCDRPLDERTPIFNIYIGKEFGNQVQTYREFDNCFVTSRRDDERALKHYRLRVESQNVQILPGSYVMRFFADSREVAVRYLVLENSLLQSQSLPLSFQP
jgi:hypothetical protein